MNATKKGISAVTSDLRLSIPINFFHPMIWEVGKARGEDKVRAIYHSFRNNKSTPLPAVPPHSERNCKALNALAICLLFLIGPFYPNREIITSNVPIHTHALI